MVADRGCERGIGAVVHVCRLDADVAERRRPKLIAVGGVAREVFAAIVLVRCLTIELVVGQLRNELRHCNRVLLEVAEHLVRATRNAMTADASGLPEEKQRSTL